MRNRERAVLVALAAAWAAGCAEEEAGPKVVISLGATISRTGSSAVDTWVDAFNLGLADANAGLAEADNPKNIEFQGFVADSANISSQAAAKAIELVNSEQIKGVINGTSGDSLALNALMYDADPGNDINIPVICIACSSIFHHDPNAVDPNPVAQAVYRNGGKWHWGLSMSALPQSLVLSRIALAKSPSGNGDINGDGRFKVATIAIDDPFGRGFSEALRTSLVRLQPNAVLEQIYHPTTANPDTYDWSGALQTMLDNRTGDTTDVVPDIVMEITFPQFSLALVKAYAQAGYATLFLHTHSMREQPVLVLSQGALEGQEGTSYLPSDGISGQAFDDRFRQSVPRARQSQWDAHMYDAVIVWSLATLIATKDLADPGAVTGAQIRDAMARTSVAGGTLIRPGVAEFSKAAKLIYEGRPINYDGASGPVDFDATGRTLNRVQHWRAHGTNYVSLATYDCVTNPADCPRQ